MAKVIVNTDEVPKSLAGYSQAASSSLERAVSATLILGEESDFAGMNEEWGKWFPVDLPARQGRNFLSIRRE